MDTHALALIAANPEPLRYSLQAFLATLPHIKSVNSVDDAQQAVVAAEVLCPALAVFDIDALGGEAESVLAQIKTVSPRTRCVVLVDSIQQQRAMEATRADAVLLKGFPAAELFAAIQRLLDPQGEIESRRAI